MSVLFVSHERCIDHDAGPGHPERPARLRAVAEAVARPEVAELLELAVARRAGERELAAVHGQEMIDAVSVLVAAGGGRLDQDTGVNEASFEAAARAAGSGLTAIERLDADGGSTLDAAFCAVRPPGHHATRRQSMGFCLFNSAAVAVTALADRGERVAVVDIDAHHGNGTQDVFYGDDRVHVVSMHQYPWYPGTGALGERGSGPGVGATLNFPFPAGTTGPAYRAALDRVVMAQLEAFAPTWLVISAGFDAHRADPLAGLELTAGDYADLVAQLASAVPAGRRLVFLEGGYDLDAVKDSLAATLGALAGAAIRPEAPSPGGPGIEVVDAAERLLAQGG